MLITALLFCKIIDNFGDAAITLRLAHTLQNSGISTFIYADQPQLFAALAGGQKGFNVIPHQESEEHGTPTNFISGEIIVIDVLEGSAPLTWIATIAQHQQKIKQRFSWFHYHYFTSEAWADDCHLLAAPIAINHAMYKRISYFPGWQSPQRQLLPSRAATNTPPVLAEYFLSPFSGITFSLFAYPNAPWENFYHALCNVASRGINLRCFASATTPVITQQAVRLIRLPFLAQPDYDWLLQQCDINLVRGEDSFTQAAISGKALIWMPYQQAANTTQKKLDAYLHTFKSKSKLASAFYQDIQDLHYLWNNLQTASQKDWNALLYRYCTNFQTIQTFYQAFATTLDTQLVHNLIRQHHILNTNA